MRPVFTCAVEPYLAAVPAGPVALIGAGGVGKAIAYALGERKVPEIRVFDADARKAQSIALIAGETRCVVCASIEDALDGAIGIINGTPVGMLPNRDTPVPAQLIHAGMFVSDAVYFAALDTAAARGQDCGRADDDGTRPCNRTGRRCFRTFLRVCPRRST